jgi:hypothetical protein
VSTGWGVSLLIVILVISVRVQALREIQVSADFDEEIQVELYDVEQYTQPDLLGFL